MRTLIVLLGIMLFLIISIPVYLISLLIGIFNPHAKLVLSQKMTSWFMKFALFLAGTKVTVKGLDNIPSHEAVLYTANHRGFADIAVSYATLPTLTGFVAKKEMAKVPVMSWWMRNLHCLFLDRGNLREGLKTILEGIEFMKNGHSMFIMPEGTRNHEAEMLPFKEGSFKMAEKTGCAIIPVAITNSDGVFEKQFPWIKRAHVTIHYGIPIYPNQIDKETKKHLGTHVRAIIQEMLNEDA